MHKFASLKLQTQLHLIFIELFITRLIISPKKSWNKLNTKQFDSYAWNLYILRNKIRKLLKILCLTC